MQPLYGSDYKRLEACLSPARAAKFQQGYNNLEFFDENLDTILSTVLFERLLIQRLGFVFIENQRPKKSGFSVTRSRTASPHTLTHHFSGEEVRRIDGRLALCLTENILGTHPDDTTLRMFTREWIGMYSHDEKLYAWTNKLSSPLKPSRGIVQSSLIRSDGVPHVLEVKEVGLDQDGDETDESTFGFSIWTQDRREFYYTDEEQGKAQYWTFPLKRKGEERYDIIEQDDFEQPAVQMHHPPFQTWILSDRAVPNQEGEAQRETHVLDWNGDAVLICFEVQNQNIMYQYHFKWEGL